MYYCKEFQSLSVLSLYEGELLGVVDKLLFNKNLKKLIEIELISEDGVKLILPTKNIYHVGKNAITVKNNQAVSIKVENSELYACPINSKAYSINGEYLGIIKEILFDEKFQTNKIALDNDSTLEVNKIASCGKNSVIFKTNDEDINLKKFTPNKAPKILKIKTVQTVETQPIPPINAVPVETQQKTTPQDANFLIGRTCTKDIVNFNKDVLIKANSKISKKHIKEVNKFGKLRELMLYSK